MKNIGIIAKDIARARKAVIKLNRWLASKGKKVHIDEQTASAVGLPGCALKELASRVDMIIVLGGDGTLLSAARLVAASGRKVPLFGVNLGSLGFMAEVSLDELYDNLQKALAGKLRSEERMMLDVSILRAGRKVSAYKVLNDAVVSKGALARMVSLEVTVGEDHLTSVRSDGLILATPTGSTAYSMSAGGPIVHPTLHCMVLTPICPHTLSNRPIAIPDTSLVRVKLTSSSEGAMLTLDGQVACPLRKNDLIEVRKSKQKAEIIKHPAKDYYDILRTKLKWGN